MVATLGKMVENMTETINKIKSTGMEFIFGLTGENMMDSGNMANSTEKVLTICRMEQKDVVFGQKAKELDGMMNIAANQQLQAQIYQI